MRVCLSIILSILLAGSVLAAPRPQLRHADEVSLRSGLVGATAKARVDTFYLLGNPLNPDQNPQHNGTFEDAAGVPDWAGWTGLDRTASDEVHWQISDFMAVNGDYSMWCGDEFDGDPGYGNGWFETLVFRHQPAGAGPYQVVWQGDVRVDTEPGYDYVHVQVNRGGTWESLQIWDDVAIHTLDESFEVTAADLVDGYLELRFLVETDIAWSDEDGLWDTDGACQLDELTVTVDGLMVSYENFEDLQSQDWQPELQPGVGDYSALYVHLQDVDPCFSNLTSQVAFIDDGIVVPGTGGTEGITWRYGPGGYIVNNTGGLAGPDHYIDNLVVSPALTWPAGCDAAELAFDYYVHEELGDQNVWPGIFASWYVRSVNTGDPADLENASWQNQLFLHYGPSSYRQLDQDISYLLEPGRTHVQVAVGVRELGYIWGWVGVDGTPAPYFDNVRLKAFEYDGPVINASVVDLFQDGFPTSGTLDADDLASNSVRLDIARSIDDDAMVYQPGDSISADVTVVRDGAVLNGMPRLHVRMIANAMFDAVRTLPAGFTQTGHIIEGSVAGEFTYLDEEQTTLIPDRYHFDLPDEGFFYPGDRLRYYLRAEDDLAGDIGVAIFPADTTGFSDSGFRSGYPRTFEVRALPAVHGMGYGHFYHPRLLLWQDGSNGEDHEVWLDALEELGVVEGQYVDVFYTLAPSSRLGNGLGGRATIDQLEGYEGLVYTSGTLNYNGISGDLDSEPSDDATLLTQWFELGSRKALMMGDGLVSSLLTQGGSASQFSDRFLRADLIDINLRYLIANQVAPRVEVIPGSGTFSVAEAWFANGGCPYLNSFDAVVTLAGATRAAEFTDPAGNTGVYPYAAAWRTYDGASDAVVVTLPMNLTSVVPTPDWNPPHPPHTIRGALLDDTLCYWGFCPIIGDAPDDQTPGLGQTTARAYPNPFNPSTAIYLDLARSGPVSVTIYNLRGERVRTLVDEHLTAGHHEIPWDGTDQQGRAAASGVYFYEVNAGGLELVEKLALIK